MTFGGGGGGGGGGGMWIDFLEPRIVGAILFPEPVSPRWSRGMWALRTRLSLEMRFNIRQPRCNFIKILLQLIIFQLKLKLFTYNLTDCQWSF